MRKLRPSPLLLGHFVAFLMELGENEANEPNGTAKSWIMNAIMAREGLI